MKRTRKAAAAALLIAAASFLYGCGKEQGSTLKNGTEASEKTADDTALTIGFAQVGEESDWRRANSESILNAFTAENGYNLLFEDAQNDPDVQMASVQKFIQEGVDYIVLEPIIEAGWDPILKEVKEAGIPVIVADRNVAVSDDSLVTAWVGSDWLLEGAKACEWLNEYCRKHDIPPTSLKIVNIQGTIGSSPQIGRDAALRMSAGKYGWKMLGTSKGEFTQAKGREAMDDLIGRFPDLNVVYCDNDNEAYGAIEALEEAGKTIGTDLENGEVMLISFDAARQGLSYVKEGKIACDVECNPDHGPRIRELIGKLERGETVEKEQAVSEQIFARTDEIESVTVSDQEYPVVPVTDELLAERTY